MGDQGEGVHGVAVHQHVQLYHLGRFVTVIFVVQRAVPSCDTFDPVVKIDQDFIQWNAPDENDALIIQRLCLLDDPALFSCKVHDVADVFVGAHEVCLHHRLGNGGDEVLLGKINRVVDVHFLPAGCDDLVYHAGIGGDDVHVELAPQPLLNDLQMEQAKEAAPETEAKRDGTLRLIEKRRVVELQLGQIGFQVFKIRGVDRVNAAEHHRLYLLKSRQRS